MEKLNEVIKEVLKVDPVNTDENQKFIDMEVWDSMTFMYFIAELEEKLEITLTNQEILDIDCIKRAREIVLPKLN